MYSTILQHIISLAIFSPKNTVKNNDFSTIIKKERYLQNNILHFLAIYYNELISNNK